MERVAFRIRQQGRRARVEYLALVTDDAVVAGFASPGWAPLVTGFDSIDEARASFAETFGSQEIDWTNNTSGTYLAFGR